MEEIGGEGHTGYPQPKLLERAAGILEVGPELVREAVEALLGSGLLRALETGAEGESSAHSSSSPPRKSARTGREEHFYL